MFSVAFASVSTVHHEYEWEYSEAKKSERYCCWHLQPFKIDPHNFIDTLRMERQHNLIPVVIAPGSVLVYAGDTGEKRGYFDKALLSDPGSVKML